jgi:hypothetical protein
VTWKKIIKKCNNIIRPICNDSYHYQISGLAGKMSLAKDGTYSLIDSF